MPRLANSDAAGANVYLNAPTGASLATGTFGSAASNEKPLAEYSVRRSALETLPDGLDGVYHLTLRRIESQSIRMAGVAKKALSWVLFAKRALTMEEGTKQ